MVTGIYVGGTHDPTAGHVDLVDGMGRVEDAVSCDLGKPPGMQMEMQADAVPALLSMNFPTGQEQGACVSRSCASPLQVFGINSPAWFM